jgi:hypothetical protein
MTTNRMPMRTTNDEDAAHALAAFRNQHSVDYVVVEGPAGGEWTVMHISEAIENGFRYSWRAR